MCCARPMYWIYRNPKVLYSCCTKHDSNEFQTHHMPCLALTLNVSLDIRGLQKHSVNSCHFHDHTHVLCMNFNFRLHDRKLVLLLSLVGLVYGISELFDRTVSRHKVGGKERKGRHAAIEPGPLLQGLALSGTRISPVSHQSALGAFFRVALREFCLQEPENYNQLLSL